ncbi:MAG: thioredoxin-like domain-containing protein [Minicystis sp.]
MRVTGTWAASLAMTFALAACDEKKGDLPPPPPMTGRANAVAAKPTATASAPQATTSAAPAGPPRQLCTGQKPRSAPKSSPKTAAASDATPPAATMPIGVGKWTWINLWAAWCGPCKEEMPRLIAWQKKLSDAGVMIDLAFVSLDDDERQMRRFLEAQPKDGVRATYWLPEGERSGWLGSFGLKESPQLPVQILMAPSGQATCVIEGAVEDRDYPAIAAFVGAKK